MEELYFAYGAAKQAQRTCALGTPHDIHSYSSYLNKSFVSGCFVGHDMTTVLFPFRFTLYTIFVMWRQSPWPKYIHLALRNVFELFLHLTLLFVKCLL